jgi:6-pyruvoyltetrahydropterin/6-carboxytetrahydropterin synthase
MYIDRVEVTFDAGHRILGHRGKCAAPHGHTYRVEVFVVADQLSGLGFALDFGDLKAPIKRWIDDHWDHAFLINATDHVLLDAIARVPEAKVYVLKKGNPSAELLAEELFEVATGCLSLPLAGIRVWESSNQYSEYYPASRDGKNSHIAEVAIGG